MPDFDMRSWALRGAEQRLLEIASEADAIYRAFPELRNRQQAAASPRRRGRRPAAGQAAASAQPTTDTSAKSGSAKRGRRRRGTLSADARKRIAEAQKKRWAAWRAKRKNA